jgi:hypothetical protein
MVGVSNRYSVNIKHVKCHAGILTQHALSNAVARGGSMENRPAAGFICQGHKGRRVHVNRASPANTSTNEKRSFLFYFRGSVVASNTVNINTPRLVTTLTNKTSSRSIIHAAFETFQNSCMPCKPGTANSSGQK